MRLCFTYTDKFLSGLCCGIDTPLNSLLLTSASKELPVDTKRLYDPLVLCGQGMTFTGPCTRWAVLTVCDLLLYVRTVPLSSCQVGFMHESANKLGLTTYE